MSLSFRCPTCGDKQPNPLCRDCGADMDPIEKHFKLADLTIDWDYMLAHKDEIIAEVIGEELPLHGSAVALEHSAQPGSDGG